MSGFIFLQQGSQLWCDINHDGRMDEEHETVQMKIAESSKHAAQRYLETVKDYFPIWQRNNVEIIKVNQFSEWFEHPAKNQFLTRLTADIDYLKGKQPLLPEFEALLADLEAIKNELPYIRFEKSDSESALASYYRESNTIKFTEGCGDAVLVHELSHMLLDRVHTQPYSRDAKLRTLDGGFVEVKKIPWLPSADETNPQYSFTLDHGNNDSPTMLYDESKAFAWNDTNNALPDDQYPCPSADYIAQVTADEVYALQNEARFILMRGDYPVTKPPAPPITTNNSEGITYQKIEPKTYVINPTPPDYLANYYKKPGNPSPALRINMGNNELMIAYWTNLPDLVEKMYSGNVNFTNTPECVVIPEKN